jgi:hypothetical protein
MLKAFDRLSRHGLFCTAPVGMAGSASLDLAGAPAPGEMTCLIVVSGLFFFAGYWLFARWGKPEAANQIKTPILAVAG